MNFDERDFLNADEEYEMMYADELEIMKEMDQGRKGYNFSVLQFFEITLATLMCNLFAFYCRATKK